MEKFMAHHATQVSCTLSGFDRLVFRGTLLPLMPDHAMFHFSDALSPEEQRRLSAKIRRLLRLLRAHGIIKKISKTHRYQLSERGRLLTAALHATRDANLNQLLGKAA